MLLIYCHQTEAIERCMIVGACLRLSVRLDDTLDVIAFRMSAGDTYTVRFRASDTSKIDVKSSVEVLLICCHQTEAIERWMIVGA